jgi:hypothetical protein
MSRTLSSTFLMLFIVTGPLASVALAGSPLKCIEVRCRSAIQERKSGSVIFHDCTRKHGAVVCADHGVFAKSTGAPLKGVDIKTR